MEVEQGSGVRSLLSGFGYTDEQMRRVAVVINGKRSGLDETLRDGDDVRFVLLAGGG